MGVILHGQPPDAGKRLRYEEALKFLDGFLAKSMWVAGQQMTIADFCVIANIATAEAIGIELESCTHLTAWYERAKEAMELYGYEEINQEGADMLGKVFNSKLKQ